MLLAKLLSLLVLAASLLFQSSYAQDTPCFEKASIEAEVNHCGALLIFPLESQVKSEFQRIAEKYKNNAPMQETLKNTQQSWNAYRNTLCIFEGMAAAGGQSTKPLSLEASKSFLQCVHRTLQEMQAALSKL